MSESPVTPEASEIRVEHDGPITTITIDRDHKRNSLNAGVCSDIADAVAAQTGVELDRRQLVLDEPIKTLGTHLVPAKLHTDVEFPVTIEVVAG